MTRKTSKCYLELFKFLEEKLQFQFQPKVFMTDYEEGMRLAIKEMWKDVDIRGCWFHFCRAILKRARKLGMMKLLNRKPKAWIIIRSLMSLALLTADRINEGYKAIKCYANKIRLLGEFKELFVYFERYWLNSQVCFQFIAYLTKN